MLYIALCNSALAIDVNVSGKLLAPACGVELPPDNVIALPDVTLARLYKGDNKPAATQIKVICHELTSVSFVLRADDTKQNGVIATSLTGIGLELKYGLNLTGGLAQLNRPGEVINHTILNEGLFLVTARPIITDENKAAAGNYAASALLSVEYR
ncbi:fimbrial protein [Pantoea sp. C2G6]|uniref:fimbrial protein n=1 Tax=Pantoea sp. C2G6 TaxID=3243084 RepID=UPI003F518B0F